MTKIIPIPYFESANGDKFPQIEIEFKIQQQDARFCISGYQGDNVAEILKDSDLWKYEVMGRLSDINRDLCYTIVLGLHSQRWPRNEFPNPWVILMTRKKFEKIILPLYRNI